MLEDSKNVRKETTSVGSHICTDMRMAWSEPGRLMLAPSTPTCVWISRSPKRSRGCSHLREGHHQYLVSVEVIFTEVSGSFKKIPHLQTDR